MSWLAIESVLRLGVFATVFSLMALLELLIPCRHLVQQKSYRWLNNIGMVAIDTLLLRILFPTAAVGVAILANNQQWGLLHQLPSLTDSALANPLIIVLSVILLDFFIWVQHLIFHKSPLLWRLHRMHHSDIDIDVTTALRFHPVEIILSMLIKAVIIVLLGIPAAAVLIFEVLLNATAMFNHSNIKLPHTLDRLLRLIIVTPDMHRVHHSWRPEETNSNYGFNLPWWDRLARTYRDQPRDGHNRMTIGLTQFRDHNDTRLDKLLLQPLRNISDA